MTMAIGQRIKHIRNLRGLTQKELGEKVGFSGKTSDVRIAQYETETRIPKENLLSEMAGVLNVSPKALAVPNIDSYVGVMHTLFALEDRYGLKIDEVDGVLCLTLDKGAGSNYSNMFNMLYAWLEESKKLSSDEITKEDYDNWRYTFPQEEAKRFKESLDKRRKARNSNPEN
jgi:transcriptional regulator with XRE-family HTH domain